MRLSLLEGEQILQEIMPGTQDPEDSTPRKRSRHTDNRGRDAEVVGNEGEEADIDLVSDEEAGHTNDLLEMEVHNVRYGPSCKREWATKSAYYMGEDTTDQPGNKPQAQW